MKTAIIYKSKNGATEQYAKWLQQAIPNSEMIMMDYCTPASLDQYGTLIIGSYEKCGDVPAFTFLSSKWNDINKKRVYVFRVGLLPEDSKYSLDSFNKLPAEIRKSNVQFIKFPGQINGVFDKLGFKIFAKSDPDSKVNPDSKIDQTKIKPVVDFVNSGEKSL